MIIKIKENQPHCVCIARHKNHVRQMYYRANKKSLTRCSIKKYFFHFRSFDLNNLPVGCKTALSKICRMYLLVIKRMSLFDEEKVSVDLLFLTSFMRLKTSKRPLA